MKTAVLIIALLSGGHYPGDDSNVKGICNELKKKLPGAEIAIHNVMVNENGNYKLNTAEISKIHALINGKHSLIIGAGIDGMTGLKQFDNKENILVWTGHQVTDDVKGNLKLLNGVITPGTSISEEYQKALDTKDVKLIATIGVPHNKTTQQIEKSYQDNIGQIPGDRFLLVSLPGDAPDPAGVMQYYTKESAAMLGEKLGWIAKDQNMTLLVSNGPRTGKHNPDNQTIIASHLIGDEIDLVTKSFLDAARAAGIDKIIVDDFKFGRPSLFDAFLGAIYKNPNSIAVIGGDSTSQITEGTNLLHGRAIYVLENEAMNPNHRKHVAKVIELGYAKAFPLDNPSSVSIADHKSKDIPTDASIAADGIILLLGELQRSRNSSGN